MKQHSKNEAVIAWLKSQKRSASWLGAEIGVGRTQAADIVSGRAMPSLAQRIAIEYITGGAVARDQWGIA